MTPDTPAPHRIGRFQFQLPAALKPQGRHQAIYRVEVGTQASAPGQAGALWASRLATLRAGGKPPGVAERVLRSFELEPGVPALLYHSHPDNPDLVTLLAGKAHNDHLLYASRDGELASAANLEKLVRIVMRAYVPAGRQGFDIGHGTLGSEPGVNEEARLTLAHASWPEFDFRFNSRTVRELERADPLQDFEQDRQRLAAGATLTLLRNQPRTAAGLPGREGWVQSVGKASGEVSLRLSWAFPGRPGQATAPAIMIVATARGSERAALEAAWEMLLGSLQPIPVAAPIKQ